MKWPIAYKKETLEKLERKREGKKKKGNHKIVYKQSVFHISRCGIDLHHILFLFQFLWGIIKDERRSMGFRNKNLSATLNRCLTIRILASS